jgi:hypothetical protein
MLMKSSLRTPVNPFKNHKTLIKPKICSQIQVRSFSSSHGDEEPPGIKETSPFDVYKTRRESERVERQKELKKQKKLKMKLASVGRDIREYFAHIAKGEFKVVLWKTKHFFKRGYKGFKHGLKHAWIEIKKIGHGFRTLKEDLSFSIKKTTDTTFKEYSHYNHETRVRIRQTWSDLFKFIPFSVFIIIPGLELLLPAWLLIFPNSIPSQFQSESSKNQKLNELVEKQKISCEKFLRMYPNRITEILKDKEVIEKDKERLIILKNYLKKCDVMTTELLEYRELFNKYLDFSHAPPKIIMLACNIMSLQPITGLNTINNLIKLFKIQIPVDNKYVEWLTRRILFREFKLYMKKLRKDDSMLRFDEIDQMDDPFLNRMCFERAIPISILNRNQKIIELKKWHTLSNLRNVPDTLLFYCRVIKFSDIPSNIENYTDEYIMLRRCPNEIYYFEKQKMFEDTLAVDELKTLVKIIKRRRQLFKDGAEFTSDDLQNHALLLQKLKNRLQDLNKDIESSYRMGNKLIDYVGNSLILDYHMECRQKVLEKEAPELVNKAIETFGNEFYYSFPQSKEELTPDSKWVKKLTEKRDELEKQLFEQFEQSKPEKQFAVL